MVFPGLNFGDHFTTCKNTDSLSLLKLMVCVQQFSIKIHMHAHTISHPRAVFNLSLECGSRDCVWFTAPHLFRFKNKPHLSAGLWGTTLLLEPGLGLATRIPRPDDLGAHGTKESERDGSRRTQRREAEKSRDSWEVAPGVAKPFPCGLSPLFPPHLCKLQASPGPQGLHKPGKCPMVGREMWVSYSPPGIGHPCGYRGLRREPRAFPERSPAGSELAPGSATCQLCA